MKHILPELPYGYEALEPYFDKETMVFHHTKHHQAYIDKLNSALESYPELSEESVENLLKNLDGIPESIRGAVRNQGGGHANHSFFWKTLKPPAKDRANVPLGELEVAIQVRFGSFQEFQKSFKEKGLGQFGSGWVWLVKNEAKELSIQTTSNQDTPISVGLSPILGLDVWEHAYYLRYQNRRGDFIDAYWNLIDWSEAEKRYSD